MLSRSPAQSLPVTPTSLSTPIKPANPVVNSPMALSETVPENDRNNEGIILFKLAVPRHRPPKTCTGTAKSTTFS